MSDPNLCAVCGYAAQEGDPRTRCGDCGVCGRDDRIREWESVFGHLSKIPDEAGNLINEKMRSLEATIDKLKAERDTLHERVLLAYLELGFDIVVQACEKKGVEFGRGDDGRWWVYSPATKKMFFEHPADHNGSHKSALSTALIRALGTKVMEVGNE